MALITITRGVYSGGEELAESLATQLGARCVSQEVLQEAAHNYNAPEEKMNQVFEKTPSFWERMTESRRIYLAYVQAQLAEWANEAGGLVYHGHAGQELLREAPHVLKVRVIRPMEARAQRLAKLKDIPPEKAQLELEQLDEERTKRIRYFFNTSWEDASRYDLVINLEKIGTDHAIKLILETLEQAPFKVANEPPPAMQDFLLKTRIYALLAGALVGRLSLIEVQVQQGEVTLVGTITSHEALIEQLAQQIAEMPGVKAVKNEVVVGLVYHEWNV